MFAVQSLPIAIAFCVVTMLGWGSWANTQKLAGKEKWPFELFYWDYAIGVFIFSLIFAVLAWTVLPIMGLVTSSLNMTNMFTMPLAGSVIASVCGQIAKRKIRNSGGMLQGEGLAKAAQIMAYTQYALITLLFAFMLLQIFVFHSGMGI